jgi:hypothetical protein
MEINTLLFISSLFYARREQELPGMYDRTVRKPGTPVKEFPDIKNLIDICFKVDQTAAGILENQVSVPISIK